MTAPLLVVSHEATRTGSPRVLLDLLRRAAPALDRPLRMRLLAGGPLADELLALDAGTDPAEAPGAVLINGALAAGALVGVDDAVPAVVYVHEVGEALDVLPAAARAALASRADVVLCVSDRSRRDLVALGVDDARVTVLPPIVVPPVPPSPDERRSTRRDLTGGDGPLVVGCGEAGWRKGADLFVDVARRVRAERPATFVWVGRRPRASARLLDADTARSGLSGVVRWAGELADASAVLGAADLLLMTSREDPQPVVPIEAAWSGVPTVAFEVDGLADLAAAGAALTVAYPDTAALAAAVLDLLDRPAEGAELVTAARRRAEERQSSDVVVPAFVAAIRGARRLGVPVGGIA